MPDSTLMTVREVQELLRISRVSLLRWRREGRLPAARIGTKVRYRRADVEAFLAHETFPTTEPDRGIEKRSDVRALAYSVSLPGGDPPCQAQDSSSSPSP